MLSIRSSADMAAALAAPLDAEIKRLLADQCENLAEYVDQDLSELAFFIVAEPNDTKASIIEALGFDPSANREAGTRLGQPDFHPTWELLKHHERWTELVFVLRDDGFGCALFVPRGENIEPSLFAPSEAKA